jgi:hypothetical protein
MIADRDLVCRDVPDELCMRIAEVDRDAPP